MIVKWFAMEERLEKLFSLANKSGNALNDTACSGNLPVVCGNYRQPGAINCYSKPGILAPYR